MSFHLISFHINFAKVTQNEGSACCLPERAVRVPELVLSFALPPASFPVPSQPETSKSTLPPLLPQSTAPFLNIKPFPFQHQAVPYPEDSSPLSQLHSLGSQLYHGLEEEVSIAEKGVALRTTMRVYFLPC